MRVVHKSIVEEYEHLYVLWAVDSVEKVVWEVRDVVWKVVMEEMEERREGRDGDEGEEGGRED